MSHEEHLRVSAGRKAGCAILTVSDTRSIADDESGRLIAELLAGAGHQVCSRAVVPDEPAAIRAAILSCEQDAGCEAVLITGGTGIAPRDQTYEAVGALLEKRLDGFGELFRMLSFQELGASAMLSRALGGTRGRRVIFCMPGSPKAVRLAMTRLILPQLGHVLSLLGG